jgi:hypothetical protein
MERLLSRAGSLLCISLGCLCLASTASAQYIFIDAPDGTTWIGTSFLMYVDVLDASGNPLDGMTTDSFCLHEDGANISTLIVQQLQLDSCITSICLMVDVSGSMLNAKLDFPKEMGGETAEQLG